ncbi:hypothetical protein A0256_18945 [Mucilaginibacter sp. PAMC 26640]|nr:hypothetical protein A0256_18945 [Mucilaginibacter sp. PAMC 26640]
METNYLKDKKDKKKSAMKAVWLLVIIVVAFLVVILKIAGINSLVVFKGLPSSDDAYSIAKGYIRPTVRSNNVNFEDNSYKFAKKSDSVYVIKSTYSAVNTSGESATTNFTISLRYVGGNFKSENSWKMLDLNQDN